MRIARVTAAGYPHHVLHLGKGRRPVFLEHGDYGRYLELLEGCSAKYGLDVWAYCLMSDHIHLVCVPVQADSLSKTLNTAHMRYAQYFNEKNGQQGPLWRGRFYSCLLSDRYVCEAVRYVENNPVRRGLVGAAPSYAWSSAVCHSRREKDPFLRDGGPLLARISDWPVYLRRKAEEAVLDDIRRNTMTGRPCGDEAFIREIEGLLNRKLKAAPRGRPKKRPVITDLKPG